MKNKVAKFIFLALAVIVFTALFAEPAAAQCAMCKASSEANLKTGGGDPRGLNAGILYMLAMPYLLVMGIGYWWWSNRKKERQEVAELSEEDLA